MISESISVVMPVHNAQNWVFSETERLLDCLSDMFAGVVSADAFEVIVVDDGSIDATAEIVDDMRRRFPQVRSVRMYPAVGMAEAARKGIESAKNAFVFVQESSSPIRLSDLRQLWKLRHDRQLVVARAQTSARRIDDRLLQRLTQWGRKVTESPQEKVQYAPLQMLRRDSLHLLSPRSKPMQLEVSQISHRSLPGPTYTPSQESSAYTV